MACKLISFFVLGSYFSFLGPSISVRPLLQRQERWQDQAFGDPRLPQAIQPRKTLREYQVTLPRAIQPQET